MSTKATAAFYAELCRRATALVAAVRAETQWQHTAYAARKAPLDTPVAQLVEAQFVKRRLAHTWALTCATHQACYNVEEFIARVGTVGELAQAEALARKHGKSIR